MKTALVLEGGASRALFGVGVTDILLQHKIVTDMIVGSSAGIANGISYAAGQYGRARDIAVRYSCDPRYMGARHLFNRKNRSFYNISFVFDEIPNQLCPFDYESFSRSRCKAFACVTNMRTGKAEYLPVTADDHRWQVIVASCALPILFEPVEIDGEPYMDGGIADSVPVDFALQAGCERVLCILTRERGYQKKEKDRMLNIASQFYRQYPVFAALLKERNLRYNQARAHLYALEAQGKIMIIEPSFTGRFKRTEKDPEKIAELYQQGVQIAQQKIEEIKKYLLC